MSPSNTIFPPPRLHPPLYQTSIFPTPLLPVCCFLCLSTYFCRPLALLLDPYPSADVFTIPSPTLGPPCLGISSMQPESRSCWEGSVSETPALEAPSLPCSSSLKTRTLAQVPPPCLGTAVRHCLLSCCPRGSLFQLPLSYWLLKVELGQSWKRQKSRAGKEEEWSLLRDLSFECLEELISPRSMGAAGGCMGHTVSSRYSQVGSGAQL